MTARISSVFAASWLLVLPVPASAQGPLNEDQKFVAPDASIFARFGIANAVGGNHQLVGAGQEGSKGSSAGAAYLFDRTTNQFRILVSTVADDDNGPNSGACRTRLGCSSRAMAQPMWP